MLVGNEFKKLETSDSSILYYLVFQSMYRYLKGIAGVGISNYIYYWKPKRFSDKRINSINTSDYGITPYLS